MAKLSTITFSKSIVTNSFLDIHGFRKKEISLDKPIATPELCSGMIRLFYILFTFSFFVKNPFFAKIIYGINRKYVRK